MNKKLLLLGAVLALAACNNHKGKGEEDFVLLSESTTHYFYDDSGKLEDTDIEKSEYSYSDDYRQLDVKSYYENELNDGYGFKYNKNDQEIENYFGYFDGGEFICTTHNIMTYEGDHILTASLYDNFKNQGGQLVSSMEYYWMNRVLNTISIYTHDSSSGSKTLSTLHSYTYGVDFEEQKTETYLDVGTQTMFQKLVTKEENGLVKKSMFIKETAEDEYILFVEQHTDKTSGSLVYAKTNLGGTIYEQFHKYDANGTPISIEEKYDGEEHSKTAFSYSNGVLSEEDTYFFNEEANEYTDLYAKKVYTSDENGVVTKIVNSDVTDGQESIYSETTFTYEVVNHKVTAIPDAYRPISKVFDPYLDASSDLGFIVV